MTENENSLNWFEISVADISRAKKFYEAIFGFEMRQEEMMGMKMAFFPASQNMDGKVSGSLVESQQHKPSADGAKIYLNGNPDLSNALSKIEAAGGKVVMPKTKISDDIGHMAFFIDSEGNAVALHSNN
jgi:predicted enzyme related to lactoylglutathione lyase